MTGPKNVLYFAENALSAIQGGGIVAYAVLKELPAERLLGFYEYRNITPVPEYVDRFVYLGPWRTPRLIHAFNRATRCVASNWLHRMFTEEFVGEDLTFVRAEAERRGFTPEVVYFSGLSYRYLRLAVLAAEYYNIPMVVLHMDNWMEVDRAQAGARWGDIWDARIVNQMTRAAARSLVSTSNSPRLAARLTAITGYRHVAANNCCSDLMELVTRPAPVRANRIPVITYAGALNQHLQGETLHVLASAVTELNAEGTRVHLHIYTPWEFAPYANSMTVPHAVFYKGQVGRDKLADIYRRSDFLATTVTYREHHIALFRHSLSTKLSEYLCAGKPVISMGHHDWHLHEYVQDHGCGFSIPMDEDFSRAKIKEQVRRVLATDRAKLEDIGLSNRALWERAHDVTVMARQTRRAIGLPTSPSSTDTASERRGVLCVGGRATPAGTAWAPLSKVKAMCRALVDVFGHTAVDVIGDDVHAYPELRTLVAYCQDIGLAPTITDVEDPRRWEPAGARWSLAPAQREAGRRAARPLDVFGQVATLRDTSQADSPARRAVNQLSVRVSESGDRRPVVWLYGSGAVGLDVIAAIVEHPWLAGAVTIGGFLSSPEHCTSTTLHGHPLMAVDGVDRDAADFVIVTSETSRLAIQEQLSRHDLLDRMIPLYGTAARLASCGYERIPSGPGQAYAQGLTAEDYATRELRARTADSHAGRSTGSAACVAAAA